MHPQSKYWGAYLPDLRWSLIAAMITLLAIFIKNKKIFVFKYKEANLFLLFVLYVIIQNVWPLNSILHFDYTVLVVKYFIFIVIIQNVLLSDKDFKGFVYHNIIGCGYIAYIAISSHTGGRFEGIGGAGIVSANQLSQHLIVIITLASYLLLCNIGKARWFLIPLIVIVLKTTFMTESRSSLIALGITGVVSLLFIPYTVKRKFLGYCLLGMLAAVVLVGPSAIKRFDGFRGNDSGQMQDESARSRWVIIKAQYEMFKESPWLGYGHRGTLLLSPYYIDEAYRKGNVNSSDGIAYKASHNFLMALLVDHGLIGATIYLLIIYSCLNNLFKIKKMKTLTTNQADVAILTTGALMGLICFMIAGLGSNNKVLEVDIWIYMFVAVMMDWLKKQQNTELKNVN